MVLAAALASAAAPLTAGADQLATDRAEAQYLADRIASLGLREDALSEQYDEASANLAAARLRVHAASRATAAAYSAQRRTISLVQQDAIEAYVGGGPQATSNGSVPGSSLDNALERQELANTFASQESDDLDSYREAAANYTTEHTLLVAARNADARVLARLEKAREQVEATQSQLMALQSQVTGEIASLVYQIEQARLAAEQRAEQAALLAEEQAQAAAQAAAEAEAQAQAKAEAQQQQQAELRQEEADATTTTAPPATTTPTNQTAAYVPTTSPQIPGVSAAASIAVQAAESRVGDPYVWGAAGPDAFDCSGLVMWAYAQAGVGLPHFSGSQFADTVQIPLSDLEPGDLVFPADPGEHVAMYVGNGEIVQAPYSGADVQIVPLDLSFFVYATRVE